MHNERETKGDDLSLMATLILVLIILGGIGWGAYKAFQIARQPTPSETATQFINSNSQNNPAGSP